MKTIGDLMREPLQPTWEQLRLLLGFFLGCIAEEALMRPYLASMRNAGEACARSQEEIAVRILVEAFEKADT